MPGFAIVLSAGKNPHLFNLLTSSAYKNLERDFPQAYDIRIISGKKVAFVNFREFYSIANLFTNHGMSSHSRYHYTVDYHCAPYLAKIISKIQNKSPLHYIEKMRLEHKIVMFLVLETDDTATVRFAFERDLIDAIAISTKSGSHFAIIDERDRDINSKISVALTARQMNFERKNKKREHNAAEKLTDDFILEIESKKCKLDDEPGHLKSIMCKELKLVSSGILKLCQINTRWLDVKMEKMQSDNVYAKLQHFKTMIDNMYETCHVLKQSIMTIDNTYPSNSEQPSWTHDSQKSSLVQSTPFGVGFDEYHTNIATKASIKTV